MKSLFRDRHSVGADAAWALLVLAVSGPMWAAQATNSLTEQDYLADMPVVLSVSRLAQRLDEAPGAVTVIDRDTIRQSGARDVADLLRLVPGFQTSTSFESVAPLASYHGKFDDFSNRLELLIDGRSVYSTYFIGSIGPGLQTVALEDIERIEVLRGSNSAAYGARAFLGVINIVTRHSADTLGAQGAVTVGENGVRDAQAGIGWTASSGTYRLTVDRRADDGLQGANGVNSVERVNFRADISPRPGDEVALRTGHLSIDAGKGRLSLVGNPPRPTLFTANHLQLDYRHSLGTDQDVLARWTHHRESYADRYVYQPIPGAVIDYGGHASSDVLTLQHSLAMRSDWRGVWGMEYRREQITSPLLFSSDSALTTDFYRLFGNVEWRISPKWLVNAGALAERSSNYGSSLSPRLMMNWHLTPGQTVRIGVSKAFRPPSPFEKSADLRFLSTPYIQSSGTVQPETVLAKEIGYLAEFTPLHANLDVRLFDEQIKGFIRQDRSAAPADYYNSEDFAIRGFEYQLKWQPWAKGRVVFSQTHTDIGSTLAQTGTAYAAPKHASALLFTQAFAGGVDMSLIFQDQSEMTLQGSQPKDRFPMTRTDLRLAKAVHWGTARGELALVIQNLGDPYRDFDPAFSFSRRAFVTLRLQQ